MVLQNRRFTSSQSSQPQLYNRNRRNGIIIPSNTSIHQLFVLITQNIRNNVQENSNIQSEISLENNSEYSSTRDIVERNNQEN